MVRNHLKSFNIISSLLKNLLILRYDNMTSNYLACKLQGSTVGIFNGSLIVSQDNGRSISDPKTFLVTPDELIYNFQTYAGNKWWNSKIKKLFYK